MSSYVPTKKNPKQRKDAVKQFVAWARVSSRPQELEGCSLATQDEGIRAWAAERDGIIKRMFKITETASKADNRKNFKEMLAYCKANSAEIDGILVYKVDRAARNMADYGRLLDLEVTHGIPLIAVSQPTQDNPAGRMARNMMAAMGTFFAEQLSSDVKDGLARRVKEGWFPTVAPYGYISQRVDGRSVVVIEEREAANVKYIFNLYAYQNCTLDMVLEKLNSTGRNYTSKQTKWNRSKIPGQNHLASKGDKSTFSR